MIKSELTGRVNETLENNVGYIPLWEVAELVTNTVLQSIAHQFTPERDVDELCMCGKAWNTHYHSFGDPKDD